MQARLLGGSVMQCGSATLWHNTSHSVPNPLLMPKPPNGVAAWWGAIIRFALETSSFLSAGAPVRQRHATLPVLLQA